MPEASPAREEVGPGHGRPTRPRAKSPAVCRPSDGSLYAGESSIRDGRGPAVSLATVLSVVCPIRCRAPETRTPFLLSPPTRSHLLQRPFCVLDIRLKLREYSERRLPTARKPPTARVARLAARAHCARVLASSGFPERSAPFSPTQHRLTNQLREGLKGAACYTRTTASPPSVAGRGLSGSQEWSRLPERAE